MCIFYFLRHFGAICDLKNMFLKFDLTQKTLIGLAYVDQTFGAQKHACVPKDRNF